jgi:hypothetical protein
MLDDLRGGGPFAQYARRLIARGYKPLPIIPGSKKPGYWLNGRWIAMTEWSTILLDRFPTPEEMEIWGRSGTGQGVVLGPSSNWTVGYDVDTDDERIKAALIEIFPGADSAPCKRGQKGATLFGRGKLQTQRYFLPGETRPVCELLVAGKQTVLPPTIHPDTKEAYFWVPGGPTLEDVPPEELPELPPDFARRIAEALRPFGYDKSTEEPKRTTANGTKFDGDNGFEQLNHTLYAETPYGKLNVAAMANLDAWVPKLGLVGYRKTNGRHEAIASWRASSNPKLAENKRQRALSITSQGIRDFADPTGDNGKGYTPIDFVMKVRAWPADQSVAWLRAQLEGTAESPPVPEWTSEPDWSMLDDRRGELPEFPLDAIGPEWSTCIRRAAHGAATMSAHVAVPFLGIASALIGTARRLKASSSWSQPATIWAAVVGHSGTGKSPGLQAIQSALDHIMKQLKTQRAELQRAHATKVEIQKAAEKKWKAEVSEAVDAGTKPPDMPKEAMPVGDFVSPRHYVSDTTVERLAVLLTAIPRGTLLLADELSGLFLNMSRYNGGQDNEFWLQSWNGSSYVVERMGRPPIELDHLLIGMVGGLQPDKLAKSFEGAADGMYARVCFSWPAEPPHRPLSKEALEVDPEFVNALRRLIDLPSESEEGYFVSKSLPLSDEALREFEQFRQFVHDAKQTLDGRDREWMSKAPAHTLRLALTLAFLVWARNGGPEPTQIDKRYMVGAVRIVRDYFALHSRAALRQIGLSERHVNARQALRWTRLHGKTEVSVLDVRRDALSGRLDEGKTVELLDAMERGGWLRKVTTSTGSKGGRPKHRWLVNPLLLNPLAETAETPSPEPAPTPLDEVSAVSAVSAGEKVTRADGLAAGLTDQDIDDFINW